MTGSKSTITHLDLPVDDPSRRRPDIAATQAQINWHPKVPLRDGLEQTITYFENQLAATPLVITPLQSATVS